MSQELTFDIDMDSILRVTACEKASGAINNITIASQTVLSKQFAKGDIQN